MPETTSEQQTGDVDLDMLAAERRRARGKAHRERRRKSQRIVWVICAASILGAAFAPGEPTGNLAADVVERVLFAFVITAAASRAKRWTWFVVAGAAGAVGSDGVAPLGLGLTGLSVALGSLLYGRRQRELGAVVGALAVQALLRLPTDLPFTVPTITAVLAPMPLLLSALGNVRRPRRYIIPGIALTAALIAIGGVFVFAMLRVEERASGGVRAARAGLEAASDGEDQSSERAFARAEEELRAAADTAGAWWLYPARAVPVLAQHVTAVDEVAREGRAIAALGADQSAILDIEGLSSLGGGFDLAAIAELAPRARTVADSLDRALRTMDDVSSPWLVPPVVDKLDEFAVEVASVAPAARNAADALALGPDLLGADGTRRYIVLVGNPAEARELGGFIGAAGVLSAERGHLEFVSAGAIETVGRTVLDSGLTLKGDFPPPIPASNPMRFVQNWGNTADFLVSADIATQLGPAVAGAPVDGVLYLDPHAIAAMLEITGPVMIEGRAEPLRAEDAVQYLQRDQYLTVDLEEDGQRRERLREAAEAAFDRLTSGSLPNPRRAADVLSPAVRARRLLFTTTDEAPHALLERVGLRPGFDLGTPDQLLVAQENLRTNKLDAYLERALRYDVTIDGNGSLSATLTVELTNTAPASGLDPYVTGADPTDVDDQFPEALNRISLGVYSPFEVTSVTIDGVDSGWAGTIIGRLVRTATQVDIPAQTTVVVEFRFAGTLQPAEYRLAVVPNATAARDSFEATIDRNGRQVEVERRPLDETVISHGP